MTLYILMQVQTSSEHMRFNYGHPEYLNSPQTGKNPYFMLNFRKPFHYKCNILFYYFYFSTEYRTMKIERQRCFVG